MSASSNPLCDRVLEASAEGEGLSPELRAHVRECPACGDVRAMNASLERRATSASAPEPSAELRALMGASVKPVARVAPWRRLLGAAGAFAAVVLVTAVVRPRDDLHEQMSGGLWPVLALAGLAVALGAVTAAGRGELGLGVRGPARAVVYALCFAGIEAAAWLTVRATPHSHHPVGGAMLRAHFLCAAGGLLFASLVGAAAFYGMRHSVVRGAASAGLSLGLLAGATAALGLQLQCAIADPLHVGVSHLVALLVAGAAGALLGRRVLAV